MNYIVYNVETIPQLHEISGFDKSGHALVTVIDYSRITIKAHRKQAVSRMDFTR